MNQNIKVLVLLLTIGTPLAPSSRKDSRGTIVVIGRSQTKIVIAVDSRSSPIGGLPRDDACKILSLDDYSVFTASGLVTYADARGTRYLDAFNDAADSFESAKKQNTSIKYLRRAASEWGERVVTGINRGLSNDTITMKEAIEDNRFLNGTFIGFENGVSVMYQEEIEFDPTTQKAINNLDEPKTFPEFHWGAMGHSEIAKEVLMGQTAFAQREQQKWSVLEPSIIPRDREIGWAIQLVKLSMIYGPHNQDIGGPIDALEITAQGIRWVKRKPICN